MNGWDSNRFHEPGCADPECRGCKPPGPDPERSRLFVAIRRGIPLDKPWRGEALDLISKIFTGDSPS